MTGEQPTGQGEPSTSEIAALTARLRDLSNRTTTPVERAQFQADKHALLERITASTADPASTDRASTDAAGAGSTVVMPADRLRAGDRFIHAGQLHWVDDQPIAHDGVLTVPTTNSAGDALWVDLPGDSHVTAHAAVRSTADGHPDRHSPTDRHGDTNRGRDNDNDSEAGHAEQDAEMHPQTPIAMPAEMPAEMLEGIEQRRTAPAERDDPAELQARLAELSAQICARTAGTGPPAGGWRTVSAHAAAEELARRGPDLDTARGMVADYLRETSERAGAPAYAWGLDQGDIDAVAAAHQAPARPVPAYDHCLDDSDDLADNTAADGRCDAGDLDEGGFGDDPGWSR